jgi:hypothetical protein
VIVPLKWHAEVHNTDIDEMVRKAMMSPGVAQVMEAYGRANEQLAIANPYIRRRPRRVIRTSNSTRLV